MELNALTHMAMSKKIESMRPRQLYQTCIELAENLYTNDSNSIIYSLACVAKAEARLSKISKLNLPKQTKDRLHNALGRIPTYSDCTITDSELLQSIFTVTTDRISLYLRSVNDMLKFNQFLIKLDARISKLYIYFRLPPFEPMYSHAQDRAVFNLLTKLIPDDSPIFDYMDKANIKQQPTIDQLNKVPIDDILMCIQSINELKELHDRPTTN